MTADPPGRDAVSVGTFPVSSQVQAAPLQRIADLLLRFGFLKRCLDVAGLRGGGSHGDQRLVSRS